MAAIRRFWAGTAEVWGGVRGMGIHEAMAPGLIQRESPDIPYLFMCFHGPSLCASGHEAPQEAAGRTIVWSPGTRQRYGHPSQSWDHSWLVVGGEGVQRALRLHPLPLNELLDFDAGPLFAKYLGLLHDELKGREAPDNFVLEELMSLFVFELLRLTRRREPAIPENIRRAHDFMVENLARSLSLPELAKQAALSVPRFVAVFKHCYGQPPMRRLNELRLRLAAQMLSIQCLPVKEVARQTGFDDPLYFSRKFRALHGRCPQDFKPSPQAPCPAP